MSVFWSVPQQIIEQQGPADFRLADSSQWHTIHLRKVAPSSDCDQAAAIKLHNADIYWYVPEVQHEAHPLTLVNKHLT